MHAVRTKLPLRTPRVGEAAIAEAFAACLVAEEVSAAEQVVVAPGSTGLSIGTVPDDPDEETHLRVYGAEMACFSQRSHASAHFSV
jgi:hypothetical protein